MYYHCTGGRSRCGNAYVREEDLSQLFAGAVKRVQMPPDVADWIAEAPRDSKDDKERFHRTAVMQLQQNYLAVQAKLDRSYEDRIAGRITDELWLRKSGEWEAELAAVFGQTSGDQYPRPTRRPRARFHDDLHVAAEEHEEPHEPVE